MKRRRSARIARPSRDRPTAASSRSPDKMPRRAEKCGTSRIIKDNQGKNKKTVRLAPTIKQKEPAQPAWPIMTEYHQ